MIQERGVDLSVLSKEHLQRIKDLAELMLFVTDKVPDHQDFIIEGMERLVLRVANPVFLFRSESKFENLDAQLPEESPWRRFSLSARYAPLYDKMSHNEVCSLGLRRSRIINWGTDVSASEDRTIQHLILRISKSALGPIEVSLDGANDYGQPDASWVRSSYKVKNIPAVISMLMDRESYGPTACSNMQLLLLLQQTGDIEQGNPGLLYNC